MIIFLITTISRDLTKFDLIGIILGHVIFAVAITQLLDWSWLKNLMSEEDKLKMLSSYNWKDLLVDISVITIVIGVIFLIISFFI
tara:strand:+ start:851 stop:1105 length:255 start_codon:yes stop_codon:yes gene_type:complete